MQEECDSRNMVGHQQEPLHQQPLPVGARIIRASSWENQEQWFIGKHQWSFFLFNEESPRNSLLVVNFSWIVICTSQNDTSGALPYTSNQARVYAFFECNTKNYNWYTLTGQSKVFDEACAPCGFLLSDEIRIFSWQSSRACQWTPSDAMLAFFSGWRSWS